MRVLINAAYLPLSSTEEYDSLLAATFDIIISRYPEHHFIFVCTSQFAAGKSKKENCAFHIIDKPGTSLIKYKYWLDISLPRLLKKYKIDLFVSAVFCSLKTSVPQIVWMPVIDNEKQNNSRIQRIFYKKYIPLFIEKAKQVITFSKTAAADLNEKYPAIKNKISIVAPVISPLFKNGEDNEMTAIKDKYSEGKEFFLYSGDTSASSSLLNLLKAFSLFKKRQRSSTKLLLAIINRPADLSFKKNLATYKYRNDVLLMENVDEKEYSLLLSSAYAFVYPVLLASPGLRVLHAIRSHVPVIASESSLLKELAPGTALYCNAKEPASIADQLMRLYKDENLRGELAGKAATAALQYDPVECAEQLWIQFEKAGTVEV